MAVAFFLLRRTQLPVFIAVLSAPSLIVLLIRLSPIALVLSPSWPKNSAPASGLKISTALGTVPPTSSRGRTQLPAPKPSSRHIPAQAIDPTTASVTRKSKAGSLYGEAENTPAAFRPDNLELYVRLNYKLGWNEARSVLLPSMQLFWPHASLVVCLDAEQAADQEAVQGIAKQVANEFPPVKARGILIADYPALQGVKEYHGWQRGQLDMMFADTVVKARYVGFCDTDAIFVTLVSPDSIFLSGKPIIHGSIARAAKGSWDIWWHKVAHTSEFMLKKPYLVSCMSFFPVLLATQHIKEMRSYVERIHGKAFVEVYKEMLGMYGFYCHFSIMCNYIWHFERDKYEWRYQNYMKNKPGWDTPRPHEVHDFSFLTKENVLPYAGISAHLSYTNLVSAYDMPYGDRLEKGPTYGHLKTRFDSRIAGGILTNGFCYVSLAQCRRAEECETYKKACSRIGVSKNKLQVLLFRFEIYQTWEWDRRVIDGQRRHYTSLKNYTYWIPWGKKILSKYHAPAYGELQLQ